MWKYVCWPCRMPGFLMRGTGNNSNRRLHSRTSPTSRTSKNTPASSIATETSRTTTIKTKGTSTMEATPEPPQDEYIEATSQLPEMGVATSKDIQTDQPPAGINDESGIEIVTTDTPQS